MLEIFAYPPTPRAFKVMAVANYLGLDWTLRMIDLRQGDHRTPEYAAINPNMRIPALRHGDIVLWEGNAIIQYLATLKPAAGLMPPDDYARIDVARWQFWEVAHFDPAIMPFMLENVIKTLFGGGEPDESVLASATGTFRTMAGVLNAHLQGRAYVAQDQLTVADFSLGSGLIYADMARLPLQDFPEITRWYAGLARLPAWQMTLEQSVGSLRRAA